MKTKISKKTVMGQAWSLYRTQKVKTSFSWCLKKAWALEKERVAGWNNRYDFKSSNTKAVKIDSWYYNNPDIEADYRSGRYMGD